MAAPSSRTSCRTPSKLSELVSKLRNNSSNNLQVHLREIQRLVRNSKGLDIACDFRKLGGLDEVVKVVKSCSDVVADVDDSTVQVLDLALSVLATCCREQETKTRVHELDGISAIVGVLKLGNHVSIINRASRALANLAVTPKLSAAIHDTDSVRLLVKSLKETTDSNCRQSILRTLRLLADTSQHGQEILQAKALLVTLSCLDSDDVSLVGCAAHTAAELTSHLGSGQSTETLKAYLEAGRQAVEENGVSFLVTLLSHTKPSIQEHSLMALLNLMVSEGVRVAAGRAGGVQIFIDRGKDTTFAAWATYIHCLCYCCREAINRVRVRDLEGLDVLLCILKNSNDDCKTLHETILVALMEFYYDELSLNYLAVCGFIKVLVSQLKEDQMQSVVDSVTHENTHTSLMETISDKKRATSSLKCNSEDSPGKLSEGVQRKRLAPQSVGLFKKFGGAKKLKTQQGSDRLSSVSVLTKVKTHSSKSKMVASNSRPEVDDLIPRTSVSLQEVRRNPSKELPQSSPSHSLGESGMSPPASFTNYQLYVNPESTTYSPPRINWEHFLKHREQTGQDLSPRSFSSLSSPMSLSPRGDLSPPPSPGWSPQWSPQQSPQHLPQQWSSPVYSGDWSPQQDLQWSPQHSPQWEQEESSSPIKNESPVTGYPTQKPTISADHLSKEQTQENLLDPVMVELPSEQLTRSLSKETSCADKALEISPFSTPTKSVKSHNKPLVKGTSLQAVSNLTDAHVESKNPQSVKKSVCSLSKKLDNLEFNKNREINPKLGAFREPKIKNPKIKSGKKKTTSTSSQSPNSPSLDNLGSELLHCKAVRDAKFDTDMEIRQAKEKGKLRRRGYAVVTLLSRYSHMDDPSSTMANKSVVSALLNYRPSSDYLRSKCERILQRILKNRLCFEQLILEHVPMLIVSKILNREQNEKDSQEEDISQDLIKKNQSLKTSSSSIGSESFNVEKISPQLTDLKRPGGVQRPCSTIKPPELKTAWQISSMSDAKSITDSVDDSASDNTSICSMDTLESERLQSLGDPASPLYPLMVSTCQYRQGHMVKLLLSDSLNEKMACILAVPYICQSNSLKKKLLIKYKGLQILLDYLQKGNIIPHMFNKAVQCLRDLASTLYLSPYLSVSMNNESPGLRVERSVSVTNVGTKEPERLSKESVLQPKLFGESSVFTDADLSLTNDVIMKEDKFSKAADENPLTKMEMEVGHSPAEICTSPGGSSKPNQQREVDKRKAISCLPDHRIIQEVGTRQSSQLQFCSFDLMELDVQVLLDQEDIVEAHRNTLIRSSEYFSCLFEGPYIESRQKIVPIRSISKDALTFILHTLHGCLHTQCSYLRDVLTNGCNVLLESIACAGRFLLIPVQNLLCDILVEEFLDSTTVSSHYSFGLAHNCSKLTEACLLYMLTNGQVSSKHFQDLAESSCADIAFQSIKTIVADGLVQRS